MSLDFLYFPLFASISVLAFLWVFPAVNRSFSYFFQALANISLIFSMLYTAAFQFTGRGIDESVFVHLMYIVDLSMVVKHGLNLLLTFLVCFLLMFLVNKSVNKRRNFSCKKANSSRVVYLLLVPLLFFTVSFSVVAHPFVWDCKNLVSRYLIENNSQLVAQHMQPVEITPNKPKSFIYVYAESLERTFFDKREFPGLLPNLSNLIEDSGFSIEGLKQIPMTGWTIAGMTASQCGIPLATFQGDRNEFGLVKKFLPGVDCLGDILKGNDYALQYLGGADLAFGGKGNFYKSHGFSEVNGMYEMIDIYGQDTPVSKWGIYDDLLYQHAYESVLKLSEGGGSYGYVMLTLDTHSPQGFPSPTCDGIVYRDGNSKLLNSIHCTDKILSDFLYKILQNDRFSDTVVVLASDHLMMANDAGLVARDVSRENLWVAFNTGKVGAYKRTATSLDIAPTFMNIIGFDVLNFGLGVNLLNEEENKTLLELYGHEKLETLVVSSRASLWELWKEN